MLIKTNIQTENSKFLKQQISNPQKQIEMDKAVDKESMIQNRIKRNNSRPDGTQL